MEDALEFCKGWPPESQAVLDSSRRENRVFVPARTNLWVPRARPHGSRAMNYARSKEIIMCDFPRAPGPRYLMQGCMWPREAPV